MRTSIAMTVKCPFDEFLYTWVLIAIIHCDSYTADRLLLLRELGPVSTTRVDGPS